MSDEKKPSGLELLRVPFPAHQISKLPKESKAQADERKADRNHAINCSVCGGWHHKRAVHLDYVGHAALTDRLLDTDLEWNWEPVAWTPDGLPKFDGIGGLWIRLTVCGVPRLGYGHAGTKDGGDAIKEVIGDALRNAAMRFGAALDLWHKGQLHLEEEAPEPPEAPAVPKGYEQWAESAEAVAVEGLDALKKFWKDSPDACRAYAATSANSWWEALKAKSKTVAVSA